MAGEAVAVHYWEGDIPRFLKGILLEENGKGCGDF